ncbi:MAG: hypothetical protein Q8P17_01605 [bacterium]|nr:hypothetical protein [bacterium]
MAELTLEESVQQVLPTLPLPIQKFFEQRKLGEVARLIMERYALHVDQGAILERELMFLLLGLKNPDEFAEELYAQLPISKQTVRDIIADVNQEIFVPLREEMRKGPQTVPQIPKPVAAAQPPRDGMLQPRTTMIPANPQLPQRPAQTLASVPRYVPPKKYFNLQNKIPPASPKATQDTAKLLEDHEEPSPSLKATEGVAHLDISNKVQGVSSPTTETPLRQALRTVMPRPAVASGVGGPPTNLPGAMPPLPPIYAPLKPSNLPLTPSAKPYSSDPYREPLD